MPDPPSSYPFIVGTFNTNPESSSSSNFQPSLYTLSFTPPSALTIVSRSDAPSAHSWLHLTPPDPKTPSRPRNLYATAWSEPPSIIAYSVPNPSTFNLLGSAPINSRSGYVTATSTALYTAGGATGEVFALDPKTGGFASSSSSCPSSSSLSNTPTATPTPIQTLSFLTTNPQRNDGSTLDFGGLRHGAHSADLSPSLSTLYIADIGRNCIWTYTLCPTGHLTLVSQHPSPRPNDGSRHVWPHPSGSRVYVLQEHSCTVDVFTCTSPGEATLSHEHRVRIIPPDQKETDFWADEVRTSLSQGTSPRYLYASTRGLEAHTKGYVAVFALTPSGAIDTTQGEKGLLDMYTTPTSGGWANAVQPGPTVDGVEYIALTDSEEGLVMVLSWDGVKVKEAGRVKFEGGAGAATAVWW